MEERKAADILSQHPIEIKIGNSVFTLNRLSLENRTEIAALAAEIPDLDIDIQTEENLLPTAIEYGKYGQLLARIIAEAANPQTLSPIFQEWFIKRKKEKIYRMILKSNMDFKELYSIWITIANQIAPAFFLSIFTSLKGMKILKPTKETNQTVRM